MPRFRKKGKKSTLGEKASIGQDVITRAEGPLGGVHEERKDSGGAIFVLSFLFRRKRNNGGATTSTAGLRCAKCNKGGKESGVRGSRRGPFSPPGKKKGGKERLLR